MPDDLALVGPYPPGYGGVSVHLQRLLERLRETPLRVRLYNVWSEARGPGVVVVRRARPLWLAAHLMGRRERLLHFHHPPADWMRIPIHEYAHRLGRPFLASLHNPRMFETRRAALGPWRRLVGRMLRQARRVHAVHPGIADRLLEIGVPPSRIVVYPAWLPCRADPEPLLAAHPDLRAFLEAHHPTLLVVGGFLGDRAPDIYGLWPAARLVDALRRRHPEVGLLVFLGGAHRPGCGQARAWRDWIVREGLEAHVGTWSLEEPVAPLFRRVDLHLRPTTTDGDANSIREALDAGTPVCASDAAPRAAGVETWPTGDEDAMVEIVERCLADLPAARQQAAAHRPEDPFPVALSMYREVLDEIG